MKKKIECMMNNLFSAKNLVQFHGYMYTYIFHFILPTGRILFFPQLFIFRRCFFTICNADRLLPIVSVRINAIKF